MANTIKVAVIGCGGIAQGHVGNMLSIPGVEVAALMDPDPNRLDGTLKRFPALKNVPTFDDYKKLIKAAELDAVIICSPHYIHSKQILDSLQAGLHVLTEKPMVCTIQDARKVMKAEKKARRIVAISYQRHCQGPYQFIRNQIASAAPGKVMFVSAFQGQAWLQGCKGTWRHSLKLSCGGQLNDSGSHLIDIILWMTGLAVEEVNAGIDNCGTEVDINSAISMRFKGGALGTMSVVGSCPVFWEDITIVCQKWAFFIRQGQLSYTTGVRGEYQRVENFNYGAPSPDHNFIDAIRGKAQAFAPSICGLRTIELTEAAWRSGASGKPVRL
jgi:predicted dehydrogenase